MNWSNLGNINKRFSSGINAFGPFNLPVNFAYTGINILVNATETQPIHCVISIEISFDSGVTYQQFLTYTWDFTGVMSEDGEIGRDFGCTWDLPQIYRGTKIRGSITLNRAARFSIDFNSGSIG